jgi:hypothetical protein
LAFDVIRSVVSTTPSANIQSVRARVSICIALVDGVALRIALIATVLSVNDHTYFLPVSLLITTAPKVDAASSRSQMRRVFSTSLHSSMM